ncbi:ferritin-like domain-containing protein [Crocosphaera subtropica]|nr:DUF2202 domain-containing protein [Crocosphaera subtropica]
MRHQHRRQRRFNHSSTAATCLAVMATTNLVSQPVSTSKINLDARTQQAMIDAINDEYYARALYNAIIEKFGQVRPFINIVQAENRHVQLWNKLFNQYGLPIPEDAYAGKIEAPDSLKTACQMGVEGEIANVQMYDKFLEFVQERDLRAAFTQLREVSQNRHKVAFERCLSRFSDF